MATLLQLEAEPYWDAERLAPAQTAFVARMRSFYGLGANEVGSKGDAAHLRGRHRSRNWSLHSRFCTDRSYGTSDSRDKTGDGDAIRATDIGIAGPTHWAATHRLDAAVRAGRLPAVAEWFGTFDGRTVVGWFEGHTSSSDDSHLTHLHVGLWTSHCNDAAQLLLLGDIITGKGDDDMTPAQAQQLDDVAQVLDGLANVSPTVRNGRLKGVPLPAVVALKDIESRVAALGQPQVDAAAVAAALAGNAQFLGAISVAVADELARRAQA